jgi:hypothetical protein
MKEKSLRNSGSRKKTFLNPFDFAPLGTIPSPPSHAAYFFNYKSFESCSPRTFSFFTTIILHLSYNHLWVAMVSLLRFKLMLLFFYFRKIVFLIFPKALVF